MIQDELREGSLVLIVDDSQLDRTLMQHLCKSIGYETLLAADGREALDIVRTEPNLALMLTDMMMPDIDGVELLKQVRYSHPRLPVMLISGHSREEINSALRGIEVSLVVQKPIQPEELVSCMEETLGAHDYSDSVASTIREHVVNSMADLTRLGAEDVRPAFLHYGPALLGDVSVVTTFDGVDLSACLMLSAALPWWTRLAQGRRSGSGTTTSVELFDCAGQFADGVAEAVRNGFGREGMSVQRSPRLVLRGPSIELLSQSIKPSLVLPFRSDEMRDLFYVELRIERLTQARADSQSTKPTGTKRANINLSFI